MTKVYSGRGADTVYAISYRASTQMDDFVAHQTIYRKVTTKYMKSPIPAGFCTSVN